MDNTMKFLRCVSGETLGSDERFVNKLKEGTPGLTEEWNVEGCDVILAFCPVVSRAGTNIESALEKLQHLPETKPVVLVVLHLTLDSEALVPDSKWSVHRENSLTVDCLFNEDKGLLHCNRNREALEKASLWITSLVKKQNGSPKSSTSKLEAGIDTTNTLIKQLQDELQGKDEVLRMVKDELNTIIKNADRNQRQLDNLQVENLRKLLSETKKHLKNTDTEEKEETEEEKRPLVPNMHEEMSNSGSNSGFDRSEAFTSTPNKENNTILEDEEGVTPDHQGVYNELLSTSLKEQRQDTRTKIPDGVAEASEADTSYWYRALGKIQEEEERGNTATEEQTTRKELHDSTQIPDGEEEMSSGSSADLRLVLLGRAGSRTSLVGNTILGLENSEAGTSTAVQRYKIRQGYVCYRNLSVLETPDEMFSSGVSQEEIRHCVRLSAPGPHAFLILIPVEESTGEERGMLEKMEEMFGEMCWRNTILLLTVTDERQKGRVEDFVRSGNQELQRLKEKCGNRIHCLNVQENRDSSQVPQLLQKIQNMVEENPERYYSRDIYQQIREMERRVMGVIIRKINRQEQLGEVNRGNEKLRKKKAEMEEILTQEMWNIKESYDGEGWIEEEKELMKIVLPEVHSMLWDLQIWLKRQVKPQKQVKNKLPGWTVIKNTVKRSATHVGKRRPRKPDSSDPEEKDLSMHL